MEPPFIIGDEHPVPSEEQEPHFTGKSPPLSEVDLSLAEDCSAPFATIESDADGLFTFEVVVETEQITAIYATARDTDGSQSDCVLLVEYSHSWGKYAAPWQSESQAQAVPQQQVVGLAEVGFCGDAEEGAVTLFYEDPSCEGETLEAEFHTDESCVEGQGFRLFAGGAVYGQTVGELRNPSDCVHLVNLLSIPTADELEVRITRAQTWAIQNGDIVSAEFLIGGYSRPHALVKAFREEELLATAEASEAGLFELLTPQLSTPTSGDMGITLVASEGESAPFAQDDVLLVGHLDFQARDGHHLISHLEYALQRPDGSLHYRDQLDEDGRASFQIVAGMGLTIFPYQRERVFAHSVGELKLHTLLDLTPGAPIVWDYDGTFRLRCEEGLCTELEPPVVELHSTSVFIWEPPMGTQKIHIIGNCGTFPPINVETVQNWPHAITVELSETCISESASLRLIATGLDEAQELVAWADYSSEHRNGHQLEHWYPAEELPLRNDEEHAYTLYNDKNTDVRSQIFLGQTMFNPERKFYQLPEGLNDFLNVWLSITPGAQHSVTSRSALPHVLDALIFALQWSGENQVSESFHAEYAKELTSPHAFNASELALPFSLHHAHDISTPTTTMRADGKMNKALVSYAELAIKICTTCPQESGCPTHDCQQFIWRQARNPWGDATFTLDFETARSFAPDELQPHIYPAVPTRSYRAAGVYQIEGAPVWSDALRDLGYAMMEGAHASLVSTWGKQHEELRLISHNIIFLSTD